MKPEIRLSCAQCRIRKKKCDKGAPCSACREAGLNCEVVQRARLPRGRSAKTRTQNAQLEDRLARIETMLQQVRQPTRTVMQDAQGEGLDRLGSSPENHVREKTNRYVASDFWDSMSREVAGLRDVFDISDDEDKLSDSMSPEQQLDELQGVDDVLFPHANGITDSVHVGEPPTFTRATLFEIFQKRVHITYNIMHLPTFIKDVHDLEANTCQTPKATSALQAAVLFVTVCSLSEEEATSIGLGSKKVATNHFRIAAQAALARAGLIVHPNMTVLQAFVLYLNGLRACQTRASTWILFAVVVRLANALGLGEEDSDDFDPFDLQVRRRLWYQIGLMDTYLALDRGAPLMLPSKAFKTPPLDINDIDLVPGVEPRAALQGMTDMSIPMIGIEAMIAHRKLYEPPRDGLDKLQHWKHRVNIVNEMDQDWQKRYPNNDEPVSPLQKLARLTVRDIANDMQLQLRRPPIRLQWHYVPPDDDFNILERSIEVMDRYLRLHDPEIAAWTWKVWVKWYALAILLAELCGRPDPALEARGYAIAREGFIRMAPLIAEGESGLLWRPIAKLMQRVEQSRRTKGQPLEALVTSEQPKSSILQEPLLNPTTNEELSAQFSTLYNAPIVATSLPTSQTSMSMNFDVNWTGSSDFNVASATNDISWQNWNLFLDDMNQPMLGNEAMNSVNDWQVNNYNTWS